MDLDSHGPMCIAVTEAQHVCAPVMQQTSTPSSGDPPGSDACDELELMHTGRDLLLPFCMRLRWPDGTGAA
jgi:hypothetical protein